MLLFITVTLLTHICTTTVDLADFPLEVAKNDITQLNLMIAQSRIASGVVARVAL